MGVVFSKQDNLPSRKFVCYGKKRVTRGAGLLDADKAEKTPVEPDPDNTGEGMSIVTAKSSSIVLLRQLIFAF